MHGISLTLSLFSALILLVFLSLESESFFPFFLSSFFPRARLPISVLKFSFSFVYHHAALFPYSHLSFSLLVRSSLIPLTLF